MQTPFYLLFYKILSQMFILSLKVCIRLEERIIIIIITIVIRECGMSSVSVKHMAVLIIMLLHGTYSCNALPSIINWLQIKLLPE